MTLVKLMTQNHLPNELMPIQVGPNFGFPGHGYRLGFRVLTKVANLRLWDQKVSMAGVGTLAPISGYATESGVLVRYPLPRVVALRRCSY